MNIEKHISLDNLFYLAGLVFLCLGIAELFRGEILEAALSLAVAVGVAAIFLRARRNRSDQSRAG